MNIKGAQSYHHSNSLNSMMSHPAAQAQAALADENLSANLLQGDLDQLGVVKHQSSTGLGSTSQDIMLQNNNSVDEGGEYELE